MNNFYNQALWLQWLESILIFLLGFYPALLLVEAGSDQPVYYLFYLLYLPIGQFSITPLFRIAGIYTYYSPMLLGYIAKNTLSDLHSGTSFDYLFVMTRYKPGAEFRKKILIYHLEGLLKIIDQIEINSLPPTVRLVGTSFFFNERTIAKLGFESEKPPFFYKVNLYCNFIDLFWMYSVS